MVNRRTLLLFLLLYLAALAVIVAVNANIRLNALRPLDISIERQITADGTVIDLRYDENDTIWLRRISPEGKLLGHIPLSTRAADDSPINYHILAVSGHKVYLHTYTRPYDSSERRDTYILICDMLTRKRNVLYRPQGLSEMNLIDSWAETASDGGLFFGFEYRDEKHFDKRLKVSRTDGESGNISEWMDVPLPFLLTCFTVTEQGGLFAASADSSVYRYNGRGWSRIFKAEDGLAAAQLLQGGDGALYLFLTGYMESATNRLLKLDPGADSFVETQSEIADCISLSIYSDDTRMALTGDYEYEIWLDGRTYGFSSLDIPFHMLWDLKTLCYMLAEALFALLVAGITRHLWLKRKTSLIIKLLAVSVPVFALGCFLLIQIPSRDMRRAVEETAPLVLLSEASKIAENIDGSRFAGINWKNPWDDDYYLELRDWLENQTGIQTLRWWGPPSNQIVENTIENNFYKEPGERESRLYANYWMYRVNGSGIYSAVCGSIFVNVEMAYINPIPRSDEINRLLESRHPVFVRFYDEEFWLALLYPVLDGQGRLTGILEVSRQTRSIKRTADSITRYILMFSTGVFTIMLLSYIFLTAVSLRNLSRLKRGALSLSDGDYGIRVPVRSRDEIGEIAAAFNGMADSVERNVERIKAVGEAYGRFVPDEMLSILRRDSIINVAPADYASLRATFLLLTTESFDSYRDEAYLGAINRFYTLVLPILSGGCGLVERFTAHELRALFDCTPLAALNTALDMFSSLNRLNAELEANGQKAIECSVLLAFSESFLGVVGSGNRLNMILQSHYAYKVESIRTIGLRYGCRLLLEQSAVDSLGKEVSRYRHRLLGYIMDGGERRSLHDFYDGEPVESVRSKDVTRERFNEAVELYYSAQYAKARSSFIDIIQQTPNDLAAREYLKKSHLRFHSDAPPDNLLEV